MTWGEMGTKGVRVAIAFLKCGRIPTASHLCAVLASVAASVCLGGVDAKDVPRGGHQAPNMGIKQEGSRGWKPRAHRLRRHTHLQAVIAMVVAITSGNARAPTTPPLTAM